MLGIISTLTAQQITSAEYFFDADPGVGNGTPVTITTPADTVTLQFNPSVTGLSAGPHYFCFRTKDSQGDWSLQMARLFYVNPLPPPTNQQIVQAEYFFDTDPGVGNGTAISISTPADTVTLQSNISTTGLTAGPHFFCLRTKNAQGKWSLQQSRLFYVNPVPPNPNQQVAQAEYFYDTDPGPGNGTAVTIPQGDTVTSSFNITNPFASGSHKFVLRTKDFDGSWSLQMAKQFNVCSTYGANSDYTYFVDRKTVYFNNISQHDTAYRWEFGDATFSTTQRNPAHTYTLAGNYNVRLISYNVCATDTFTQIIPVNGIQSIFPAISSDTNLYVGHIRGIGFQPGCVIKLIRGATTITADTSIYISSTDMKAVFKFNQQPLGYYDVIAQNLSGVLDTLFQAFELQNPRVSKIVMTRSGPNLVRLGRLARNTITIRNDGNQTIFMLPVYFTYPDSAGLTVFLETTIINDPSTPAAIQALTPVDHTYPIPNPWNPGGPPQLLMAAVVPYIGPGESAVLDFSGSSSTTGCRNANVKVGQPLEDGYLNPLNQCNFLPTGLRCAMNLAGVIPGVGCITGAANFGCTIGNQVNDALWGTNKTTWFDMVTSFGGMILQCTAGSTALTAMSTSVKISAGLSSATAGFGECSGGGPSAAPTWLDDMMPKISFNICHANPTDPNAKYGPEGINADNYVNRNAPVSYTVKFENVDTASAPAAEVHIVDRLDTSKLDLSTFHFTNFGFGDTLIFVPEEFTDEFVTNVDLRSTHSIWLRVSGKLDTQTGMLDIKFTSYDTTTFDVVTNPLLGFLPPNVNSPEGEGFIAYTVSPKSTVSHGDIINGDSASIIFDSNAPILTNAWVNTIDTVKPTSTVQPLTANQTDTTFVIHVNGSDAHAGVMDYIIYASINDSAFNPVAIGLPYDSMHFTGVDGWQYEFFSQARDYVMNIEDTLHIPDAVTVVVVGIEEQNSEYSFDVYPNPSSLSVNLFINTKSQKDFSVTLYNMQGAKQKQWNVNANHSEKLSLENFPAGMYYLKATSAEREILIKKIIVIK